MRFFFAGFFLKFSYFIKKNVKVLKIEKKRNSFR